MRWHGVVAAGTPLPGGDQAVATVDGLLKFEQGRTCELKGTAMKLDTDGLNLILRELDDTRPCYRRPHGSRVRYLGQILDAPTTGSIGSYPSDRDLLRSAVAKRLAADTELSADTELLNRLRWMRSFGNDVEELLDAQVQLGYLNRDHADRLQRVLDGEAR